MKFVPGDRVVINRPSDTPDFKKLFNGRSAIVIACGHFASTIVVDSGPRLVLLNEHLNKEDKL